MKLLLKITLFTFFCTFLLSSCYKDKGNYEYTEINPIAVSDEDQESTIFIQQNGALKLSPSVDLNGNIDDLSYEWFVYLNSQGAGAIQDSTRIAQTKVLDYSVDPNIFTIGESYRLTYKVTNNVTGISYFHFYQLTVADKFTTGWMFLEEIAEKADLSMILKDGTVFHQIYTERNPDHPLANPKSFTISNAAIEDGVGPFGKRYYITAENDAVELDGTTMVKRFDYNYLFFISPTEIKPTYIGWAGASTFGVIINKGLLHVNFVGGFPGVKKFSSQLPAPIVAYDYELAPQVVSGNDWQDQYGAIMYDMKNKRFYSTSYNGLAGIDPNHVDNSVFDMNNVGLDLIKLDSSNVSTMRNAIMRSGADPYLLQFRTRSTAEVSKITINKQLINSPGLTSALDVTCSTVTPHLYYVQTGVLYKYEITSNTYTEEYTLASNEVATKVKFDKVGYGSDGARLIVCTWNGNEGKVYYFKVNANGSIGDLDKTYTGFGKIIDLAYKY